MTTGTLSNPSTKEFTNAQSPLATSFRRHGAPQQVRRNAGPKRCTFVQRTFFFLLLCLSTSSVHKGSVRAQRQRQGTIVDIRASSPRLRHRPGSHGRRGESTLPGSKEAGGARTLELAEERRLEAVEVNVQLVGVFSVLHDHLKEGRGVSA
jgi:hypothetical protein